MKQLAKKRLRFALWVVVAMMFVIMSAGTLFAAGEQLGRGATLSGGNTRSSNGFIMRDVIGLYVAGSSISPASGLGLCSGFGCTVHSNVAPDNPEDPNDPGEPDDPNDPSMKLFMPKIERKE